MVTNASSWSEDFAELSEGAKSLATDAGQALGLVADDLIPGDAPATGEVAEHLVKLGGAFDRAGQGFKRIDTGGWHGQAADAAHDYLSTAPGKWIKASDAFNDAGGAVAEYQRVLADSQAKAASAQRDLERAERAGEQARNSHNARVDAFNDSDRSGPRPADFVDPAAGDRAAAQQAIDDAKAAVQQAGDRAARVVVAASRAAPAEPGWMTQLKENAVDAAQATGSVVGEFAGGAAGALFEMGQMARLINPMDPYRITHPIQSGEAMTTMAMGVVGAVKDPYAAVKTVVDPDGWRQNPAKNLGAMVPDALMSLAGGAGVAGRLARGVDKIAGAGGRHADDLARAAPSSPPAASKPTTFDDPSAPTDPWAGRVPEGWNGPPPNRAEPDFSHLEQRPDPASNPRPESEAPAQERPSSAQQRLAPHDRFDDWDDNSPLDRPDEPPTQERPPDPGSGDTSSSPEQRIQDALDNVRQHGDGMGVGHEKWDFEPGTDHLPEGLTRTPQDPYAEAAIRSTEPNDPNFIHRDVDPSLEENALWRASHSRGIDEFFERGLQPRLAEGPADMLALDGHVAGNTGSRFVSTTDSLDHAVHRALEHPEAENVMLKIRTGGGIDTDATLRDYLGNQPLGYISHGESEVLLRDGAHRSAIEGAYVSSRGPDGKMTFDWIDNPNFDRSILKGAR